MFYEYVDEKSLDSFQDGIYIWIFGLFDWPEMVYTLTDVPVESGNALHFLEFLLEPTVSLDE